MVAVWRCWRTPGPGGVRALRDLGRLTGPFVAAYLKQPEAALPCLFGLLPAAQSWRVSLGAEEEGWAGGSLSSGQRREEEKDTGPVLRPGDTICQLSSKAPLRKRWFVFLETNHLTLSLGLV